MSELTFSPFNMSECTVICNKIISNNDINKFITENGFDDFSISWEGIFLHQTFHLLKEVEWDKYDERMNSIYYSYLESQTMQLEWIIFSLYHGQYDLVLRELRNIVESAFLFYRIDFNQDSIKESGNDKFTRIENMDEKEKFGRKVFKESGYTDWENVYLTIYKPLCKYTHTVGSLIRNKEAYPTYNGMLSPKYDEKRILECLYYIQQIILLEIELMKNILKNSYNIDPKDILDKIFDKYIVPNP